MTFVCLLGHSLDFRRQDSLGTHFRRTFQACTLLQGPPRTFPSGVATNRLELLCYRCHRSGHISRQCPMMQDPNQTRFSCFRCRGAGHVVAVCPTPPMNQPTVQKEVPKNENPNYNRPMWCPHCRTNNHIIRNCPQLEKAVAKQEKTQQNMGALECLSDIPRLVSSMITVPVTIDGVEMTACVDTGAAANMCTREEAYKVYMNG